MRRITERALDSAQLFDGEAVTGCVCCGIEYAGSGTHCLRCQAPLDVSRTILTRGTPTHFVSLLGASGAGKTVFLGMLLDMLSQCAGGLQGVVSGTFSTAIQANTIAALESRRFPEKTPSEADGWQWVHCEVHPKNQRKKYMDIVTPDFAGEAVALEIERPGTYLAIQRVVDQSHGVLVLCDSRRGSEAPLNEDIFAMKLASYIYARHDRPSKGRQRRKVKLPLAIVLTKSDQCPEAWDDPARFAASNLPRLTHFCESSFEQYRFFGASVVAGTGTMIDDYGCRREIPLHVEPRGVIEPLSWIMGHC